MKFLFLTLTLPVFLHAGIFDWFFSEEEQSITQFECPYNCGGVGTEALKRLEIQAIRVLWELDRFSYACQDLPFSYDIPQAFTDPWAEKLISEGIDISMNNYHIGIKMPYCQNHCTDESKELQCGCVDSPPYTSHWRLNDYGNGGEILKNYCGCYSSNGMFKSDFRDNYDFTYSEDIYSFCSIIDTWVNTFFHQWTQEFYSEEVPWITERVARKISKRSKPRLQGVQEKIVSFQIG